MNNKGKYQCKLYIYQQSKLALYSKQPITITSNVSQQSKRTLMFSVAKKFYLEKFAQIWFTITEWDIWYVKSFWSGIDNIFWLQHHKHNKHLSAIVQFNFGQKGVTSVVLYQLWTPMMAFRTEAMHVVSLTTSVVRMQLHLSVSVCENGCPALRIGGEVWPVKIKKTGQRLFTTYTNAMTLCQ